MIEIWKPVVGFEDIYEVSNLGRIKRVGKRIGATVGCIRKPTPDECGYLRISLRDNRRRKSPRVHQVVAEAFIGPRPDGMEVNHKNGIRTDNRKENLEYLTHGDNIRDAAEKRDAYNNRGEKNPRAKLTLAQVSEIRSLLSGGMSGPEIAKIFPVSRFTVWDIKAGRSWC